MRDNNTWYKVYDFKTHGTEPQALFSLKAIEADSKKLVLVRNQKGYFAVEDKCPHAGYPLSHGKCMEDGTLMCIYHRYRFDLETGQSGADYVQTYPVRVDEVGVFIGLPKKSWWRWW
jgi:nitrite reductase/ring-hydroxylating ferredoxin subunit